MATWIRGLIGEVLENNAGKVEPQSPKRLLCSK